MKTGSHLKIKSMGDNVLGVRLEGNPEKPEPIYFRIAFPFGDVEVVRTDNDDYWVHIRCNKEKDGFFVPGETKTGKFIDGRIDIHGKHASDCNQGDFGHKDMYHMAVRIAPDKQ